MPTLWEMPTEEVEKLRDGLLEELEAHSESTVNANDFMEIAGIYESQIARYQAELDRREL